MQNENNHTTNKKSEIDHVSVYVSDFSRSLDFYTKILSSIGYKNLYQNDDESYAGFGADRPVFWVIKSVKILHPGHIALKADSKKEVEEFRTTGLFCSGADNGAPGYRKEYGEGYYASFILDPDQNSIEAVFRESEKLNKKDFSSWVNLKLEIENSNRKPFAYMREVWWCSFGVNIGVETDGKNDNFERPCLVLKVYNTESLLVLPITSKTKEDKFHFKIEVKNKKGELKAVYIKLTQPRIISCKRLLRKVDVVNKEMFKDIRKMFLDSI